MEPHHSSRPPAGLQARIRLGIALIVAAATAVLAALASLASLAIG
jgi:hypothetical protein